MFSGLFRNTGNAASRAGGVGRHGKAQSTVTVTAPKLSAPATARQPLKPNGKAAPRSNRLNAGNEAVESDRGRGKKSRRSTTTPSAVPFVEALAVPVAEEPRSNKRRRTGPENAAAPSLLLSSSAFAGSSAVGKAAERLRGSRFRWLNETLYSIPGAEAKALYEKDPTLATAYHEGFRAQVQKWPRNPLDDVIKWLKSEAAAKAIIGDFGCGEARLALELKGRNKVHSFDLVKVNERVTPCNLAAVPLPDSSLDIAVFCLALMGTDWPLFLGEAHRCLRSGGLCHIVEVESRFTDVGSVVRRIEAIGFKKVVVGKSGNFFFEMRFSKTVTKRPSGDASGGDLLSSCIYRRR